MIQSLNDQLIKQIGESILVNKKDIEHLNKKLDESNSVCKKLIIYRSKQSISNSISIHSKPKFAA